MPIDDKEMTKINIRLSREEKNICDSESRKRGVSRNALFRGIIRDMGNTDSEASLDDKINYIVAHIRNLDDKN